MVTVGVTTVDGDVDCHGAEVQGEALVDGGIGWLLLELLDCVCCVVPGNIDYIGNFQGGIVGNISVCVCETLDICCLL